jgi:hypothetical protein
MKQVWNILAKDIRRHWREVAASLALLVAFAWLEVRSWPHDETRSLAFLDMFASQVLPGLVTALVPISWIFLIVRVVQGDSLVGDRQFWVTRPYDWKKLLLAKAIFVLVFVNLPLFVLDIFLLAKAGFHPASYLPGLLFMQWMWILLLFLTSAGLAAVTATIGQMLLAMLFVALYIAGVVALSFVVPNSSFPTSDSTAGYLLVATALAVILLQYSRRKTALSRWLILGLGVALTLQMVATPYRAAMARQYPLSSAAESPLTWSLLPSQAPAADEVSFEGGQVPILFPFNISGLPQGSFLQLNGVILTLTNGQGQSGDSGWQFKSESLFPEQKTANITLFLKRSVFDRMKTSPVKARLLLAYTLYHDKNQRTFVVPSGDFALPDLGLCSPRPGYWHMLDCREPLRGPTFLMITSEMATSTCPVVPNTTPDRPGQMAFDSIQNSDPSPAQMGISPVKSIGVYVTARDSSGTGNTGICPGTPLVLSNPEETSRGRVELQFDNMSLADYQRGTGLRHIMPNR